MIDGITFSNEELKVLKNMYDCSGKKLTYVEHAIYNKICKTIDKKPQEYYFCILMESQSNFTRTWVRVCLNKDKDTVYNFIKAYADLINSNNDKVTIETYSETEYKHLACNEIIFE